MDQVERAILSVAFKLKVRSYFIYRAFRSNCSSRRSQPQQANEDNPSSYCSKSKLNLRNRPTSTKQFQEKNLCLWLVCVTCPHILQHTGGLALERTQVCVQVPAVSHDFPAVAAGCPASSSFITYRTFFTFVHCSVNVLACQRRARRRAWRARHVSGPLD